MLYIKLVWMYAVSMFTAIIIYPLMHETGHFLAALLVGADVIEISVFPVPYVSMFVDTKNQWGQALIGLCGMIFPMLCMLLRPKRFMSVIVVSTIILINVIAWLLSSVALVADRLGVCWENEDIVAVTQSLGGAESSIFFICLIAMIVNVYSLFKRKTICRIMSFF